LSDNNNLFQKMERRRFGCYVPLYHPPLIIPSTAWRVQLSPIDRYNRDQVAVGGKSSYSRQPISPVVARSVEIFEHVQIGAEYGNARR